MRDRHSGARIQDVAIAPSVDLEEALVVAAGCHARPPRGRSPRSSRSRTPRMDGCRCATACRPPAGRSRARRRARFTRPWRMPCSMQMVAARSAAYSLPMPPKSISMPARGRRMDLAVPLDAGPVDERRRRGERRGVRKLRRLALEIPRAPQHARRDVEESAAQREAVVGVAQQRGGLGVDRRPRRRPRPG